MAAQLDKATEDFLKRTAGGSDTAAPGTVDPETEKFLARTGAAPPASTAPSLADVISSPEALQADLPASQAPMPTMEQMHNALQYAPDTIYGSPNVNFPNAPMGGNPAGIFSPFARDVKTGESRFTLPPFLRDIGLTLTDPKGLGNWLTFNPQTNTYNLSPEAMTTASLGARPLRFGPPEPVPPGLAAREAPLSPAFRENPLSPNAVVSVARETAAPSGPVSPSGVPPKWEPQAGPRPGDVSQPTSNTPTTSDAAKAIATAYYKTFDNAAQAGGSMTPQATNKFIASVEAALPPEGIGKAVAGENELTRLAGRLQPYKDQPMTLQDVQTIDQQLGNLVTAEYGKTGVSPIGRQLQDIQHDFRDQVANAEPGDVVGGQAGLDALAPARKAYSQAMKMDTIERMQERADQTDNPTTSFRTQVRSLLANDKRSRGFSEEEKAALRAAAERGVAAGALHVIGSRLVPIIAGGVGSAGGVAGAVLSGATAYGLSGAARTAENALAARRLQNAYTILGKSVPPSPLQPPAP